ncbi:hypothetical protein [Streptomyces wedmorensis]
MIISNRRITGLSADVITELLQLGHDRVTRSRTGRWHRGVCVLVAASVNGSLRITRSSDR